MGPREAAPKMWARQPLVMIAMVVASVGMTLRSSEAAPPPITVNTGTTTISTGTTVTNIFVAANANDLATLTVTTSGSVNYSNSLIGSSGTGTLNLSGGFLRSGQGYSSSIGNNAGSKGAVNVSSGTWFAPINNTLYLGSDGSGTLDMSGGSVTFGSIVIGRNAGSSGTAAVASGTLASAGNLSVGQSGTGMLTMSGGLVVVVGTLSQGSAGTINLNAGGTLQIGTGTNSGALLGGAGVLTNNGTLIFNRSDASTYSGVLSGSGAVVKQGGGNLTLSGSSSYSGGTTLTGGTITVGNANALGTGNLAANGGTLDLQGTSVAVATLSGSSGAIITSSTAGLVTLTGSSASDSIFAGSIQKGSGTVSLVKQGAGTLTLSGTNSYTGGTTLTAGTITVGNANALGTGNLAVNGGTLNLFGNSVAVATLSGSSGAIITSSKAAAVTLTGSSASDSTFAGTIENGSGTVSLVKQGAGTLTLSGSNSYTGDTTLTAGKLLVNGSLSNSAVTVGNGGTLGGSGTLGGLVSVQSGGVLSPGNSPGALAVAMLDLQAESRTFMEVVGSNSAAGTAGTDYDQIRVTTENSLTYGGDLVLSFISSPLFDNGTMFSLFYFTGTAGGGFNSVTTAAGSSSYSGMTFQHNANGNWYTPDTSRGQYLVFDPASGRLSIVPEPSTWVLTAIATGLLALKARRRSRVA
jgi:autotransporter-associated beta strand protein/T5SS/PEP-CTERM-associated repeat protein